jgi:hypothetical protein
MKGKSAMNPTIEIPDGTIVITEQNPPRPSIPLVKLSTKDLVVDRLRLLPPVGSKRYLITLLQSSGDEPTPPNGFS